ncbi:MAG: corrinoid protein [Anaerolineales bacterium]|jgi:5-methyltetrahydrofolate--homocysteine methyltransferase
MSEIMINLKEDLYDGKVDEVAAATQQALDEGISAGEILNQGLIAGMDVVGVDFKSGELFIPEVILCARAMHAGLEVLRPLLIETGIASLGKVVIGTVAGDMHDIGKNLVSMMLEGAGFEIIDLGTDVQPEQFVEIVRAEGADLVGMSALLTTTMLSMKSTIDALSEAGLRDSVRILVGGAPVTANFAEQIGADAYAADAGAAVDTARSLIEVQQT